MRAIYFLDRFLDLIRSFTIEHIYAYIYMSYLRNNRVIFKMLLYPHILLCICVKVIKMQEKKFDISPILYIVLMIAIFMVSL